jgi:YidC/Oxa1 family membrane protein insertase
MDRKSIVILVVSVVLLILWIPLTNRMYPPKPLPPRTNAVATASNRVSQAAASTSAAPVKPSIPAVAAATPTTPAGGPEELLVVTNANAIYTFTSRGGGLKLIELMQYPEAIECSREVPAERHFASLNTRAPVPALTILAGETLTTQTPFKLIRTETGVRAEHVSTNGLRVTKDFRFGTNYILNVTVRLENSGTQPIGLPAQEWVIGTATPPATQSSTPNTGFFWHNGIKAEQVNESWFANRTLGCIPGTARTEYAAGANNVHWAAVHNQFFTLAAIPTQPAGQVISRPVELPLAPGHPTNGPAAPGYQTALGYPSTVITGSGHLERQFAVYAGPKEYNTLARLGTQFKTDLDAIMNFGFFGFFSKMLLLSMNGLHSFGLPYGVAIILITIVIKLLFWPLTNASTRSMKRMQELQPQLKALQDKYKDEPQKMQAKMLEFYKENKVNPVGGCLPMLLQIPVFFGFYTMLQSAIELRGARFLWACDLSQADTIWRIPWFGDFPINPLPLIMGVTMLWQARLTPVSPGMDPVQQKMMKYMPLMFMFILYKMSAGLTLYWTVQNLLTIAQMKLTKTSGNTGGAAPKPTPVAPKKKR